MRYGTGVAFVALAGVLWSLQGLVFRQIDEAEPWAILFWRSLGMIPVLLVVIAVQSGGSLMPVIRNLGPAAMVAGFGLVGAFGGAVYAIQTTTVANAVFLFAAAPLLTAMLAWIVLGERPRSQTWASIALALVGIFIMVRHGLSGGAFLGNLAALVSALGFAVFTVAIRSRGATDTLPFVLVGGLMALTAGGVVSEVTGGSLLAPASDIVWAMFMGGGLLTGGLILYTRGSRVVPAAELALLSGIEVVLAPVWVWIFLNETADENTLIGGAFILIAALWNGVAHARRSAGGSAAEPSA
jgi:drug/metabolite transporter (DMT)-like permease